MALVQKRNPHHYLNVSCGELRSKERNEIYQGFRGVIADIRMKESLYQKVESTKLELVMIDPDEPGESYVISGTLASGNQTTTYGRMMIGRLASLGIEGVGMPIEIGIYPFGEKKSSCVSLKLCLDNGFRTIKSVEIPREEPDCRHTVQTLFERIRHWYAASIPANSDIQPDEDAAEDDYQEQQEDDIPMLIQTIERSAPSSLGNSWQTQLDEIADTITNGECIIWKLLPIHEMRRLLRHVGGKMQKAVQPPTKLATPSTGIMKEPNYIIRIRSEILRNRWTQSELDFLLERIHLDQIEDIEISKVDELIKILQNAEQHKSITEALSCHFI